MNEPIKITRKEFANELQNILKNIRNEKYSIDYLVGDSEQERISIKVKYEFKQTHNAIVCYDKNEIVLLKLNECFTFDGKLCYSEYGLEEAVNYIFEKQKK